MREHRIKERCAREQCAASALRVGQRQYEQCIKTNEVVAAEVLSLLEGGDRPLFDSHAQ